LFALKNLFFPFHNGLTVGWMLDNGKRKLILLIGIIGMALMPMGYLLVYTALSYSLTFHRLQERKQLREQLPFQTFPFLRKIAL